MARKYWIEQDGKTYNLYEMPKGFVIKGDVMLATRDLAELPDLSEVIVEGDFYCYGNRLTSLKGCPKEVGGSFYCGDNELTSLEGAPQKVGGVFQCQSNELTSLEGAPERIGGEFDCHNNLLTTLRGAPQEVGGDFICHDNLLTSLRGGPRTVHGDFSCRQNKLTTFENAPQMITGSIDCRDNSLTSLYGLKMSNGNKWIFCDDALAEKYGFARAGFPAAALWTSPAYQNEKKIDELRQKQQQEQAEKRANAIRDTQAKFDAWLKNNGKNAPEK